MATLAQWLALVHLPGVGPAWFARAQQVGLRLSDLFDDRRLSAYAQAYLPARALSAGINWEAVERDLRWEGPSHAILSLEDPRYPPALRHIAQPPPVLFVQGNVDALHQKALALVGARQASPYGCAQAQAFALALGKKNFVIVSGLARGVDACAHEGALRAPTPTIAVLGHGLHTLYPREHQALADKIQHAHGALVSEFPVHTPPHPRHFPRRNRIISGLSCGVIVVEAALKSGSLITARYALDQGREVFAIPGDLRSSLTKGCHALIREGATLVESASHVLEELPIGGLPTTKDL